MIEESDDGCTRQMRSDMSAAKKVDPSAFKHRCSDQVVRRGPSWFPNFLNMSDGAQAVGGRLGVRYVAGSIIADDQVTARSQAEL